MTYASVSGIVIPYICNSVTPSPLSDCLALVDCLSDLFKSQEAFYSDACGGKAYSSSPCSAAGDMVLSSGDIILPKITFSLADQDTKLQLNYTSARLLKGNDLWE